MEMSDKRTIKVGFCDFWPEFSPTLNSFTYILKQKYNLIITTKDPDFLFYSCFGVKNKSYKNCIKIFYTNEAVTPNFNDCDYAIGFDFIDFGERYLRKNTAVQYTESELQELPDSLSKRKFCNFIYRNIRSGKGTEIRQDFCKELMCYKHVDCPGEVLNNIQNVITPRFGDRVRGKLDFIKDYKFTIAFENCKMEGYTSEKLVEPLLAHSIPIYWGNPKVTYDFNPKAFVNCNDFKNLSEVIEYVKYLDTNDDAYMAMLREPPMQKDFIPSDRSTFLYNIIEKGDVPYGKNPRGFRLASFDDLKGLSHTTPLSPSTKNKIMQLVKEERLQNSISSEPKKTKTPLLSLKKLQCSLQKISIDNSIESQLGKLLLEKSNSIKGLLSLPFNLLKIKKKFSSTPPKELGGKSFIILLNTYENHGLETAKNLLTYTKEKINLSPVVVANAYAALAKRIKKHSIFQSIDLQMLAYEANPCAYHLKWLAFFYFEAREISTAQAVLELLPENDIQTDYEKKMISIITEAE